DDDRDPTPKVPFLEPTSRPLQPTLETIKRWEALPGRERFRDPDYMRYLQSRRSHDSLVESGRAGFRATSEKYGYDYAMELSARFWREHPERASLPERQTMQLLQRLGQQREVDYHHIHKLAPGVWSDFAWPDKMKAIEVWGGIHDQDVRERVDPRTAEQLMQRDSERIQKAVDRGWSVKVVMAHELKASQLAETERHIGTFLDPRPSEEKPHVPGVFEPSREPTEEKLRYAAAQRLEILLLEADERAGLDYARDFRPTKGKRLDFAWFSTRRGINIYRDEEQAREDLESIRALRQKGWEVLQLTRDRDMLPQNELRTRNKALHWAWGEDRVSDERRRR
ncbi:MAG: hypothetical protein M3Q29_07135, partial [Chloroflexota bacterium]|nr:hypothetical protein [Chloroflexota bacterium]